MKKNNLIRFLPAILVVVSILFGIYMRSLYINFESGDYESFLSKWYDFIKAHGISALKDNFSNYNLPYLYLLTIAIFLPINKLLSIKLISIIFDFIAATAVYKIVSLKYKKGIIPVISFCLVFNLPTVILNGSLWGQCDIIYTSFILISLYYLIIQKNNLSLFYYTIALLFKLQAIFVFPIYLLLLVQKRLNLKNFFVMPLAWLISVIPAIVIGKPLMDTILIYFRQAGEYKSLTLNAPNVYQFLTFFQDKYYIFGMSIVFFIIIVLTCNLYLNIRKLQNCYIIEYFLLASIFFPFILPRMHERYFFIADILSVIYAFYYPKRFFVPIFIVFASSFSYFPFLFEVEPIKLSVLSCLIFISIFVLLKDIKKIEEDKINKNTGENNKCLT